MVETSVAPGSVGQSLAPLRTPEHEGALEHLVREAVPAIGDGCVIEARAPGPDGRTLFAHVVDAAQHPAVEQLTQALAAAGRGPLLARVIASGRPIVCFDAPREHDVDDERTDTEHLRVLSMLGARASITLPLVWGRETLGALLVMMGASGREFEPEHLVLVQDLARRAAAVLARAVRAASATPGGTSEAR
ncbi:GAF domain-containing protein [Myxococcota bacterium]|nr:GAF domain-containing protein [Myxococcota bacterium]